MVIERLLSGIPRRFHSAIKRHYSDVANISGNFDADIVTLDVLQDLKGKNSLLAANDSELCDFAKMRAQECFEAATFWRDAGLALEAMRGIAVRYGVVPPDAAEFEPIGQRARLLCDLWWRRQLRKTVARKVESAAIKLGLVSKRAGIYASDETVERRQGQRRRNAALLKSIIAVNDEGQEYTLDQLSALGVSNPEIRRMELMTRLAGFDSYALHKGHSAMFYTMTAPSRFHAIRSDGKPNPKYQRETPRVAQSHLCKGWQLARATLAKRGIRVYGFRVVEPHHDGTPHWHMVLFMESKHVEEAGQVLRKYALREDGNEFGAAEHRFKAEAIDRKRGSAVGYLAKYISKNINAKGIEDEADFEGGTVSANAQRVDSWAACWGIRQFQQIGGASVGVWRELRREADTGGTVLSGLAAVADVGDWAGFTELMGGAFVMRSGMAARVRRVWFDDARTRYDGAGMERIDGVESCISDEFVKTRLREWVLKRAHAPAWSSVNNCNRRNRDGGENRSIATADGGSRSDCREGEKRAHVSKNEGGGRIG